MPQDVQDIDKGYNAAMGRLVKADGMELRVGVQSGKPRYPKHGRTPVAKVAGIQHVMKLLSTTLDERNAEVNRLIGEVNGKVVAGMEPEKAILQVGEPYRDAVRDKIRETLHDTGLLERNIGAAVYAEKKWVLGDPQKGVE